MGLCAGAWGLLEAAETRGGRRRDWDNHRAEVKIFAAERLGKRSPGVVGDSPGAKTYPVNRQREQRTGALRACSECCAWPAAVQQRGQRCGDAGAGRGQLRCTVTACSAATAGGDMDLSERRVVVARCLVVD